MRTLASLWLLLLFLQCVPGVPPGPGRETASFRLPALHAAPDPENGGRIVDAFGREALLRGVNVNAFVEYWAYDPERFTAYPFTAADADEIAGIGWNAVRLLLSWSRVEPEPGVYDDAYLDEIEAAVRLLQSRGIYTILDLHQDAWGATLAAPPGTTCPPGSPPAFGWDGAPGWATLDGGARRCASSGQREFSPAVLAAFQAFWDDAPGPGGVGIQARYHAMLRHLAERFARLDAVAGYDPMNEPNAFFFLPGQDAALSDFYARALAALREGEQAVGAPRRLLFFEPSPTWAAVRDSGVPPAFARDDQVVYSPHIYQGGIDPGPLDASVFELARDDASGFGGAPVMSGEWGSDPRRAEDSDDDYFLLHQTLQDDFRFGATLWTWREACGDPHKAGDVRAGRIPFVWGLFEVDCAVDAVLGVRTALAEQLRRPLLRAAPGPIASLAWDPATGIFEASGEDAKPLQSLVLYLPAHVKPGDVDAGGLFRIRRRGTYGPGQILVGWARGGAWELRVELR